LDLTDFADCAELLGAAEAAARPVTEGDVHRHNARLAAISTARIVFVTANLPSPTSGKV
jgi:hypothetical protein